jgi:Acyl-CoA thioester hydrolase/BAAT N-terminal region
LGFSVVGCAPGELVTVGATWTIGGQKVQTEAQYIAPASGVVEPAKFPSVAGTYTGVEPYGLWWTNDLVDVPEEADILEP